MKTSIYTKQESLPEKIRWNHSYSVGKEFIDNDHRALFDIYNKMVDCLDSENCRGNFALLLSDMTDYSLLHFAKEEEYMRGIDYPNIKAHREQHKNYIKKTALYNSMFNTSAPPNLNEVVNFLKDWWREHILFKDMKYERYRRECILKSVSDAINSVSTDDGKRGGERFFKESVNICGAKSADVSAISRKHFGLLADKEKTSVFALCQELLRSGILEKSFVACDWSYRLKKEFTIDDFELFEFWINNYITNWATCDTFCNHTMGAFIDMWPEFIANLKKWTLSPNRWVRRAAAVSLIIPAREGRFREDIFEIADLMLTDKDDMVQKGYGWMLKACSRPYPEEVYRFVLERRAVMPRTALRYAIEKLPEEMKKVAMQK